MTPCCLVGSYHCLEAIYCLHLHGRIWRYYIPLKCNYLHVVIHASIQSAPQINTNLYLTFLNLKVRHPAVQYDNIKVLFLSTQQILLYTNCALNIQLFYFNL